MSGRNGRSRGGHKFPLHLTAVVRRPREPRLKARAGRDKVSETAERSLASCISASGIPAIALHAAGRRGILLQQNAGEMEMGLVIAFSFLFYF